MVREESADRQRPVPERSDPEKTGPSRRKLRLDQFLKLSGLADTGGQAKVRVQWGDVKVNGEVCTARGRGLKPGDRVELDGQEVVVEESLWEQTGGV